MSPLMSVSEPAFPPGRPGRPYGQGWYGLANGEPASTTKLGAVEEGIMTPRRQGPAMSADKLDSTKVPAPAGGVDAAAPWPVIDEVHHLMCVLAEGLEGLAGS